MVLTLYQNRRFATLISLMLSSQTKDEVTDAAVDKLRTAVGGTLSLDAVLAADEAVISEAISKVGFWRRKTQCASRRASRSPGSRLTGYKVHKAGNTASAR